MSQGPTLVGPQVAFYECGLQPLRHALLTFGSLLEFFRTLFSP